MLVSRLAAIAALSFAFSAAPTVAQQPGVTIAVWSFGFAPSPIVLRAGEPVTLTFQNRSGSSHDFTAKSFFANSRIISGSAAEGEIELGPHETKKVTLVPRTGSYKAHCSHFMHSVLGMTDRIIVS